MENQSPPWDAYQEFLSSCPISLDKKPSVRTVGVREIWHQLFAECVLETTGPESNHTCKYYQICAGLKAEINVTVHRVQYIWDANSTKENWGLFTYLCKKIL